MVVSAFTSSLRQTHFLHVSVLALLMLTICDSVLAAQRAKKPFGNIPPFELLLQDYPNYETLQAKGDVDLKPLYEAAANKSATREQRCDALVQIAISSSPANIKTAELLAIADNPETNEATAIWAIVAAGRALGDEKHGPLLEKALYARLSDSRKPGCSGAILLLAVTTKSPNNMLREWSRLLRDSQSPLAVCKAICSSADMATSVYGSISCDQAINCLLAGYNEAGQDQDRKVLILDVLDQISTNAMIDDESDAITSWYLHSFGQREFANVQNDVKTRTFATGCLQPGLQITLAAKAAAEEILKQTAIDARLLAAARHVVENAKKYGVEKGE